MERFQWTKGRIERLVTLTLEGVDWHEIARRFGCEDRTVRKMQFELDLVERQHHHKWTAIEKRIVRKMYVDHSNAEILAALKEAGSSITNPQLLWRIGKQMGLKKSHAVISADSLRNYEKNKAFQSNQYSKGHVPANKGLRRPGYAPGRMASTQFKKGQMAGAARAKWKPIGTICADTEGYLRIKVAERADSSQRGWHKSVWPLVHHRNWEAVTGKPVPPGHKLIFRDGNKNNTDFDNLELVTDAEMRRRNSIHQIYPPELKKVIFTLGVAKRKLRERKERAEELNQRSA